MNFCMSYSCGKDSNLALYRRMQAGDTPVALIVTMNADAERSWFHGVSLALLDAISSSLGIPVLLAKCRGEDYNEAFVRALEAAKALGAEACAFGDIDIEEHLAWGRERCREAGLEALFPLWQEDRRAITQESIDAGFVAVIKAVTKRFGLPVEFLGKRLTRELVEDIAARGADPCGENGEYHTFVCDGPMFSQPVRYAQRGVFESEYAYSLIVEAPEAG